MTRDPFEHRRWLTAVRSAARRYPACFGMIADLPMVGDAWTQAERDEWFKVFGVVVDYEISIKVEPVVSEGGS